MTQKELLYLEDAIGHEKSIIKICEDMIKNLNDQNLIIFMESELNTHMSLKQDLMNTLEAKSNG